MIPISFLEAEDTVGSGSDDGLSTSCWGYNLSILWDILYSDVLNGMLSGIFLNTFKVTW